MKFWDEKQISKQLVSQLFELPWGHHIAIIQKCKNNIVVEYALKEVNNPIGVTEYFTNELPKKFSNYLTKEKKQ